MPGQSHPPRGAHDLGGLPAGPLQRDATHEPEWWEKRIDALLTLLGDAQRRLIRTDELRRAIESLGEDVYTTHTYYERWTLAIATLLLEKGVLSSEELDARVERIRHGTPTADR